MFFGSAQYERVRKPGVRKLQARRIGLQEDDRSRGVHAFRHHAVQPAVHLLEKFDRRFSLRRRFLKNAFEQHRGERGLHPVTDDIRDQNLGAALVGAEIVEVTPQCLTRTIEVGKFEAGKRG